MRDLIRITALAAFVGATGTPSLGTWSRDGEGLTMVENGWPCGVEIVGFASHESRRRVHSPGQPVDLRLVPATGAAGAQ